MGWKKEGGNEVDSNVKAHALSDQSIDSNFHRTHHRSQEERTMNGLTLTLTLTLLSPPSLWESDVVKSWTLDPEIRDEVGSIIG